MDVAQRVVQMRVWTIAAPTMAIGIAASFAACDPCDTFMAEAAGVVPPIIRVDESLVTPDSGFIPMPDAQTTVPSSPDYPFEVTVQVGATDEWIHMIA